MARKSAQPNEQSAQDIKSEIIPISTLHPNVVENEKRFSIETIMFDENLYNRVMHLAHLMASSAVSVPAHLRNNTADCAAIIMQALRWGMDPYAVAQKTYTVNQNGILAYESQLIISLINLRAPVQSRLQYEEIGDWSAIAGRGVGSKTITDRYGNKRTISVPNWTAEEEKGLGVRVSATMIGEKEPRVLELYLNSVQTRNSMLWIERPAQQLKYLAAKSWARLHCPDVVLGLYSPDEIRDNQANIKPVGEYISTPVETVQPIVSNEPNGPSVSDMPTNKAGENIQGKKPFVLQNWIDRIHASDTLDDLESVAGYMKALKLQKGSPEHEALVIAYRSRQNAIALLKELNHLNKDNQATLGQRIADSKLLLSEYDFKNVEDVYKEYCDFLDEQTNQNVFDEQEYGTEDVTQVEDVNQDQDAPSE